MPDPADNGSPCDEVDEELYVYFTTKATGRLHRARNADSILAFCGMDVAFMNPLGPTTERVAVLNHHLICLYCFPVKAVQP